MYEHADCARWLRRSLGWLPLHFECDRRCALAMLALLRAGADPAARSPFGETPLRICTLADPAAGGRPESEAATALIREALLPWLPTRHRLFPRSFSPIVLAVLLVHQRLERRAARHAAQPERQMTRQRRREAAALGVRLTWEVWLLWVVPCLSRFQGARAAEQA